MSKGKVLMAMSGGIDSSIAAVLLKDQGYNLIGVTYRTFDSISSACMEKETGCCSVDAIFEAKKFAEKIGIQHHVIDFRDKFNSTIVKDFINEYLNARTPNPCILCNAYIKWGELLTKADELECDFIATGHYARIRTENGRCILSKGKDLNKDQSYFLWMLSQDNLKRTLFPLGNYNKAEIKKIAKKMGFDKLAKKRESQEICFIPDNDYRKFLREKVPSEINKIGEGDFISTTGEFLGKHNGYPFYTIGQRKGLNVSVGYPLYVNEIRKETNEVILGTKEDLIKQKALVNNLILSKYNKIEKPLDVDTRVRYRNRGKKSIIEQFHDKIIVHFLEDVSAITPGQSAVFYESDDVIGGGLIV